MTNNEIPLRTAGMVSRLLVVLVVVVVLAVTILAVGALGSPGDSDAPASLSGEPT